MTIQELTNILRHEWEILDLQTVQNLVRSMPGWPHIFSNQIP